MMMLKQRNGGSHRKATVLMVFILFLFAVSSVAMSVGNLYIGPEERAPTVSPTEAPSTYNPLWGSNYGDLMKYAWYAILGTLVVVSLATTGYAAYRRNFELLKQAGIMIVAGILIVALFYGVMYYGNSSPGGLHLTGGITGDNSTVANPNATAGLNEGKEQSIVIYGISAVMLVSAVALILTAFYYLSTMRKRSLMGSVEAEEVSRIIERTMRELWTGDDPRSSIIRCYGDMCALLEKGGAGLADDPTLTPREFLEEAEGRIPVSLEMLEELTFLFEEARYSPHELSDTMVDRAKRSLEGIQRELKVDPDEETENNEGGGPDDKS